MQSITYYNASNGQIITSVSGDLSILDLSQYESYAQIEGFGNSQTQYVENGCLVDMPAKPFLDSIFDFGSKSWVNPDSNVRWQSVRSQRDILLSLSDWTQSVDSPLSDQKKIEWKTYRQALRDITNQADPFSIEWPTKPE